MTIWSDGAKTFKNKEMLAYVANELFGKRKLCASWNFFAEYHGKSYCDSHFARVSDILCRHQNGRAEIFDSQQLKNILIQGFQQHESTNVAQNPTKYEVQILDVPEQTPTKEMLEIDNFSKFFIFQVQSVPSSSGKQYQIQTKVHADAIAHVCTGEIKQCDRTDKGNKKAPPKPTWDAKWINNIDSLMARTNKLKALENPSTEVKQ